MNKANWKGLEIVDGRRVDTEKIPPGGGACWWCNNSLWNKGKTWTYAEIHDLGHKRAVHLKLCNGSDADQRKKIRLIEET